jgi:hypothetical protein
MLQRNVAGQGIYLFAWDELACAPKTGDSANITGALSKDGGADAALGTANPTQIDATTMPGVYWQPLAQAETNAAMLAIFWKSTTANVIIDPVFIETEVPAGATGGAATYDQVAGFLATDNTLLSYLALIGRRLRAW